MHEGKVVCVVGHGADRFWHKHMVVCEVTESTIVVRSIVGTKFVYRADNCRSTDYSTTGGTEVHPTCQRPREK